MTSTSPTWWDRNYDEARFSSWFGSPFSRPRRFMRRVLRIYGCANVLDCGGGMALEYAGWQRESPQTSYVLLDFTLAFIQRARTLGIPAIHAPITEISAAARSFDGVYARHVFEHLPEGFRPALAEMTRVARRVVLHDFFIPPGGAPTLIDGVNGLWHNRYNRAEINAFIYSLGWRARWKAIDSDLILVATPR